MSRLTRTKTRGSRSFPASAVAPRKQLWPDYPNDHRRNKASLGRVPRAPPVLPIVQQGCAPTRSRDQGRQSEEEKGGRAVHCSLPRTRLAAKCRATAAEIQAPLDRKATQDRCRPFPAPSPARPARSARLRCRPSRHDPAHWRAIRCARCGSRSLERSCAANAFRPVQFAKGSGQSETGPSEGAGVVPSLETQMQPVAVKALTSS